MVEKKRNENLTFSKDFHIEEWWLEILFILFFVPSGTGGGFALILINTLRKEEDYE